MFISLTLQQVFFLLSTEGSLVITRTYPALHLGGTPSQKTGTSPPRCLLLENRRYIYNHIKAFRTLPFPTMISLLVRSNSLNLNPNERKVPTILRNSIKVRLQPHHATCPNIYRSNLSIRPNPDGRINRKPNGRIINETAE